MIAGAPGVVELTDRAVELAHDRILTIQHATLVRGSRGGAGKVDRRVQLRRPPQMVRVIAKIAG